MILGDPRLATILSETVLETADRSAEILETPASYPALALVDKTDSLQVVIDGLRRWILILGYVPPHPRVAAILRYQDRCIAEVFQRDKAVSFVEEVNLPAPLSSLEVLNIGDRVGPRLSAVTSAKYDGLNLAITA